MITTANATEDGDDKDKDKEAVSASFTRLSLSKSESKSEIDQQLVKKSIKGTIGSFIPMLVGPADRKFYADYLGT